MDYTRRLQTELRLDMTLYGSMMTPVTGAIDVAAGEVRIPMPKEITDVISRAAACAAPGYVSPQGTNELRTAYAQFLYESTGTSVSSDSVLVTAGGKEASWLVFFSSVESGQRVMVPRPGWLPYAMWARAAGAEVSFYSPMASVDEMMAAVKSVRPRLFVINFPNNPTGRSLELQEFHNLCALARDVGSLVLSDEVYRGFGASAGSTALACQAADGLFVADSVSKLMAFAGLRIGFLVAHPRLVTTLAELRGTYAACTSSIAQQIAYQLFTSAAGRSWMRMVAEESRASVRLVSNALKEAAVPVSCCGAIYVWVNAARLERPDRDILRLPGGTLKVAPGELFGEPSHLRICPARRPEVVRSLVQDVIREPAVGHLR